MGQCTTTSATSMDQWSPLWRTTATWFCAVFTVSLALCKNNFFLRPVHTTSASTTFYLFFVFDAIATHGYGSVGVSGSTCYHCYHATYSFEFVQNSLPNKMNWTKRILGPGYSYYFRSAITITTQSTVLAERFTLHLLPCTTGFVQFI